MKYKNKFQLLGQDKYTECLLSVLVKKKSDLLFHLEGWLYKDVSNIIKHIN